MTGARAWLRRAMAVLFPWPARSERREAVSAARGEKEHSRAQAGHAASVGRQIRRLTEENHYADIIAAQIIRRHRQ